MRGTRTPKIETRLIDERLVSVMGECDLEGTGDPSIFKLTSKTVVLVRMLSTLSLTCEENTVWRKWKSPLVGSAIFLNRL